MVADEGQADEETDNSEPEFVEIDAANRYGRYSEVLGKGAFKTVYRAFDELEGIEVAWNQVKVKDVSRRPEDLEHLHSELHLLQTLKHKNIIKFYKSWVDPLNGNINFITELFTSGNLKQYRAKHKRVDMRAVKNWCRQILSGLQYLHNHDPPIIHRDLKCDNIFINGSLGEVKIGDLGLAAILEHAHLARSIIGTPEFMAPEFYEEEYNELVDIYAFGMCLLELVTFEYPYSECSNPAQIFRKVSAGIKPASLARVNDAKVRRFIEKCIANVSERLPARDLLMDTFLQSDTEKCHTEYLPPLDHSDKNSYQEDMKQSPTGASTSVTVKAQMKDINKIFLKLRISDSRGYVRNIHFHFDIESDTSISVAREMVTELELTDQDVSVIAEMIDSEIKCHVPNLVPGNTLARHYADMTSIAENVEYEVENEVPGHLFNGFVLERLPSGRKYWSDSPKGSPTRHSSASSESNLRAGVHHSTEVENEVPGHLFSGFVLERLPSGRKYWSDSPKGSPTRHSSASSESNLRAGVHHSTEVHKMTNSHFGGSSREDYLDDGMQFKSCPNLASFVEREEDDFWREQLSSKGKLSEIMIEGESENIKVIMEKLENLLAEQEKELKELKKRHEENIAVILKDIPPEHQKITLQRCRLNVVDSSLAAELDRYKVP